MDFYEIFYIFTIGLSVGLLLTFIWDSLEKRIMMRKARIEGEHILQEAQERTDILLEKRQKEVHGIQEEKLHTFEREKEKNKFRYSGASI